jgi:hydroxymethylbilane synthase
VARQGLTWGTLPRGAVIATSSHRRRAQLLRARPDLELTDIRGNVDTRLKKLDGHAAWSAIVLAAAGLVRLGLSERISERLPFAVMLPAPGQGALAATIRADDAAAGEAVRRALHDEDTAIAVSAERGLLRRLQGGCQVPVGAYATVDRQGDQAMVQLRARVVALNGAVTVESVRSASTATIEAAEMLGEALADDLLDQGGAEILRSIRESGVQPISEP